MRIELAILAALGTMACTAHADGLSPTVEDATNLSVELDAVPTLTDIASKPTSEIDPALLIDLTAEPDAFSGDPCPPCGRG
jgi:hypothetical protein